MRVLFANVPWHERDATGRGWRGIRAGSRWPHTLPCYGEDMVGGYMPFPIFLATACALSARSGFEAVIRDSIAMGEGYDVFYRYVEGFTPRAVVIETSTPSLRNDLGVARTIKAILPQAIVIFCGSHFELQQEGFLSDHPEIDYAVYGEYEVPVNELLIAIRDARSPEGLDNLLCRLGDGVLKTPAGALTDLKDLPWPHREGLPLDNYYDGVCGLQRPQLQITSTRGCPFECIFCVWPQVIYHSNKYRRRPAADVVNEIAANVDRHPYRSFYIDDDTFNVNRQHVLEMARLIREHGLSGIPWGIMARADLMDEQMLIALKDAGLYSLKYGVESADQTVLDEIGKRLDLDRVREIVRFTKEIDIKVHLTFTFGLPSDTVEGIERTIDLACSLVADSVQFSIATPFPGTRMYEMYKDRGWITTHDWDRYDGSKTAVARTNHFSAEALERFVTLAYQRWGRAKAGQFGGEFRAAFRDRLGARLSPGARVLLLQSATYTLTQELLRQLNDMPYEVHLMLHERFAGVFAGLIAPQRMHVFSNTADFRYELLYDFAVNLRQRYQFAGVVIPYSNPNGSGYDEVERVALLAGATIVAGVGNNGSIVR
ncbi:MAG: B12-binding domain-containing radical SAM protein [Nitrospirae bacterium]|uniref:B12-binding domain-containing radical SAM protein n=1 Tax=Candidatus Magnetobacterium casense TaxID=1455061 RepID=UPI00058FBE48|nr:B12-binding domain-containing radical SAM protein [Candidatus Magnetobacterium casensis]MBF0337355.1 B12-binding domain-containing radical SAM protein [Nitrospirota bacterium]